MAIAIIDEVLAETRRLAVAGSKLAKDDFRLKKLLPKLDKAGEKSPVFAKVAASVRAVLDAKEKESAQALLDLGTLVVALSYTQGDADVEGEFEAIESLSLPATTQKASARAIRPVIEALTSTGSGRLETVRQAFDNGLFQDFRLARPAVTALDDSFGELADFVAEVVIPSYGPAATSLLLEGYDPKGRTGHARRLLALCLLDPKGAQVRLVEALGSGSADVQRVALGRLGEKEDDLNLILEYASSKTKSLREAALRALLGRSEPKALEAIQAAFDGKDRGLLRGEIGSSASAEMLQLWSTTVEAEFESLPDVEKKKAKKAAGSLSILIECRVPPLDSKSRTLFLSCLKEFATIEKVAGAQEVLDSVLATLVSSNGKEVGKAFLDHHALLTAEHLDNALGIAALTQPPAKVYDAYSTYLQKPSGRGKREAEEKRSALLSFFVHGIHPFGYMGPIDEEDLDQDEADCREVKWDKRWIETLMAHGECEAMAALVAPRQKKAIEFLVEGFRQSLGRAKANSSSTTPGSILAGLIRVNYSKSADLLLEGLEILANKKRPYEFS
ncbi:MAG: hypothetical protein AAF517_18855, partial [Planctomycetota bacterium]